MSNNSAEKGTAIDWIDANQQRLSDFDIEIWNYHEPALREYKSAQAYVDILRQRVGFVLDEFGLTHPMIEQWRANAQRSGSSKLVASQP